MDNLMLKIDNVSKMYKLGQIGGTTLRDELQRRRAKRRGEDDPTKKIGAKDYVAGETFMALNGVSFEVKKGERVGIIGHNGAGKSTLLKLLSRVTAPTGGEIGLNGRIASMLEVGTGFHRELTGRENIYMNGAILGMTKKEIDAKIEDIIEFSECRQFIDTPVKRYSSGMYVKLAFSVAAHLDSEIMIMDEVLAVGDMAFQKKCLEKMSDVSKTQGRTILYVSHNMNTIRQLCDRVVVLNHGTVVFDGDVEEGIGVYLGIRNSSDYDIDLDSLPREKWVSNRARMKRLTLENTDGFYMMDSELKGNLLISGLNDYDDVRLGVFFLNQGTAVTSMKTEGIIRLRKGTDSEVHFTVDLSRLAPGNYTTKIILSRQSDMGSAEYLDVLLDSYRFEIIQPEGYMNGLKWSIQSNGFLTGSTIKVDQKFI